MTEFIKFPKIPRLVNTQIIITEKIDGTNAQIVVPEDPTEPFLVGSRNRVITPGKSTDNYGFAEWVSQHPELRLLGHGTHYGEWWGVGIGRGYGLSERRWSLFNTSRPLPDGLPPNVTHVPVLHHGQLDAFLNMGKQDLHDLRVELEIQGSKAAPGFKNPEGLVLRIGAQLFKVVFDKCGPSPEES